MKRLLLFAFVLLAAAPAMAAPQGDGALMPPDGFEGWKKSAAPRVFTHADLYGYIDGGAELFLEFGFEQLTLQKYKNGASEVGVEIYRMSDPAAATGIYLMKSGKEAPDPSLRDRHSVGAQQLMLLRHRYFVIVNNLGGSKTPPATLVKFAGFVASKAPAHPAIPALSLLPPAGLNKSSVRLARGPYGLQSTYTLGEGDILSQNGKVLAAIGDYKDAAGTYTMIVVDYADAATARKAFGHLVANLDEYLKPSVKTDARLVFQDYAKKYGVVTLNGKRLEVRVKLANAPK